jgi:hypothetical protein
VHLLLAYYDGFMDPEGNLRIPAQTIHQIANEEHLREMVASYETIDSLDLAEIVGIEAKELRHQLQQLGAHRYRPEWGYSWAPWLTLYL